MEKKPYHHGNLEEALIEAGLTIVDKEGLESMSLRRVAAACGVSHAAPYKHYSNKEELLSAMQLYVEKCFAEALEQSLLAEGSTKYMLSMAQAYLQFFIDNPHYFSFFQRQQGDFDVNLSELNLTSHYKPFEIFKNAALKHTSTFGLSEEIQRQLVIAMWAMVHGYTAISVMNGVSYDGDWQELLLSAFKLLKLNIPVEVENHEN